MIGGDGAGGRHGGWGREATMTVRELESLFDYGWWANQRIFQVLAQLREDQFTQIVAGSYGSVRNTLVHSLSAEWGWLDRCGGTARGPALNADDYPTVAAVVEQWQQVEAYVRTFLMRLRDEDLGRVVEFTIAGGIAHAMPLWELLHHSAIHGAHHRGQVALLLRSLGYTPGNFDILLYYAQTPSERTA
jgi:uncharacterized damage-inducible protein DinB